MYRITNADFDRYRRYILSSPDDRQAVELIPAAGANLRSIRIGGYEWLEGCTTPEHLTANPWSRSSLLFPFPNRLRDGRYEWRGQTYQFQTNDTQRDNALHGFAPLAVWPFSVVGQEATADRATLHMRLAYDGERESYPFPFEIDFSVTLRDAGVLDFDLRMRNAGGEPIPAGLGYHPYFRVGERVDDYELHLPPVELIGVDTRMIPNGKTYDFDRYAYPQRVGVDVLDNCFRLRGTGPRATTAVVGEYGRLELWQAAGAGGYPY